MLVAGFLCLISYALIMIRSRFAQVALELHDMLRAEAAKTGASRCVVA